LCPPHPENVNSLKHGLVLWVVLAAAVVVIPGLAGFLFPRWRTPVLVVVAWCAVIGIALWIAEPDDYADLSTFGVAVLSILFYVLPAEGAALIGLIVGRLWRRRATAD